MQSRWYADNRDLVKWSMLLHLANEHGCTNVLQIAYLNPCAFGSLSVNGTELRLHPAVLEHFRNLRSIELAVVKPKISVFAEEVQDRVRYVHEAIKFITRFPEGERLIFLDPDTGLEPGKPTLKHALNREAAQFWKALAPGDILALYQHQTNRNGTPWVDEKRRQFAVALGLPESRVGFGYGEKLARDVALFFVRKESG